MMKWISIVMALLLLTGCAAQGRKTPGYRQISMEEAVAMMEAESGYRILDVRTAEEFREKQLAAAVPTMSV